MGKRLKKLFRDLMDEVLPDDLSGLAATVKETIYKEDKTTTKSRFKIIFSKVFKEPDLDATPMPSFLPEKEKKYAEVVSISGRKKSKKNNIIGIQGNELDESTIKSINNEETGEPKVD